MRGHADKSPAKKSNMFFGPTTRNDKDVKQESVKNRRNNLKTIKKVKQKSKIKKVPHMIKKRSQSEWLQNTDTFVTSPGHYVIMFSGLVAFLCVLCLSPVFFVRYVFFLSVVQSVVFTSLSSFLFRLSFCFSFVLAFLL